MQNYYFYQKIDSQEAIKELDRLIDIAKSNEEARIKGYTTRDMFEEYSLEICEQNPMQGVSRYISHYHYYLYLIYEIFSKGITKEQAIKYKNDYGYITGTLPKYFQIRDDSYILSNDKFKTSIQTIYYMGKHIFNKLVFYENQIYAYRHTYGLKGSLGKLKEQLQKYMHIIEDIFKIHEILKEFISVVAESKTKKEISTLKEEMEKDIVDVLNLEKYQDLEFGEEELIDLDTNEYRFFFYKDLFEVLGGKTTTNDEISSLYSNFKK